MGIFDRIIKRASPDPVVSRAFSFPSDLWVDGPHPDRHIETLLDKGQIDETMAERLTMFVEKGYLLLHIDDEDLLDELVADIDRAWAEKPANVAYAFRSGPILMSEAVNEHRFHTCRLIDMHEFSPAAMKLYLYDQIFRYLRVIFGEEPVATQSLTFEWGSQQALHRDPVHVVMTPPSHLVAAWIALEDAGPHCGPLTYVPGSHRLPYYEFEPGQYRYRHGVYGDAEALAAAAWEQERCRESGLEPVTLTCKKGDVLLWHHSLLHGGRTVEDQNLTRKSFVVHYSTKSSMVEIQNMYGVGANQEIKSSTTLHELNGNFGFRSPLGV